jgi:hypothetical protein
MKRLLFLLFALLIHSFAKPQIISGFYNDLKLAYDNNTHRITGCFDSYTGLDYETGHPKFSCIFYIEGSLVKNKAVIKTYYPFDNDTITGELTIINNKEVTIILPEEHGGCWNVQHFVDEPVKFRLSKAAGWVLAKYIISGKAFFHSAPNENSKTKAYIVKGDVIYIDKIDGMWVHCTYLGEKKNTIGWMRAELLSH